MIQYKHRNEEEIKMNQFFYTLKKQATNVKMNTEIFTQMLID